MEQAELAPGSLMAGTAAANIAASEKKQRSERIRIEQHGATGLLWFIGWLFSIGFLHLSFWKGLLALLIWPYFIGTTVSGFVAR